MSISSNLPENICRRSTRSPGRYAPRDDSVVMEEASRRRQESLPDATISVGGTSFEAQDNVSTCAPATSRCGQSPEYLEGSARHRMGNMSFDFVRKEDEMHLSRINPAIEGTLYLKRVYQRNLFVALLIGITLHVAALGTYYVLTYTNVQGVTGLPPDVIEVRVFESQPPRITDRAAQDVLEQVQGMIPKFGIPVAVPADEIIQVRAIPTKNQRIPIDPSGPGTGQQYAVVPIEIEPKDVFPAIDTFIIYDENPEAIHLEPAVYPTMARRAGIGGYVRVRVLLDKAGYVLSAVVEQVSTENVGFEEAAVASALKGRWTPAMQNNHPVPCWVSYKVTFDIE